MAKVWARYHLGASVLLGTRPELYGATGGHLGASVHLGTHPELYGATGGHLGASVHLGTRPWLRWMLPAAHSAQSSVWLLSECDLSSVTIINASQVSRQRAIMAFRRSSWSGHR
ncbi:hypothetical protein R1flu_011121 [Riccia fluitans]|uniref:Uncharacterized protein n=1 Tax=Riccia fluitans TaxID=41844 RepID=A0ABD1Z9E6_9MARC